MTTGYQYTASVAATPVDPAAPATNGVRMSTTSAPTASLTFGPDGRIAGLSGVLDQIFESLGKTVTPLVRDVAIPMISRDKELQKTVGAAAGASFANQLLPWFWVTTAGVFAFLIWRSTRKD